MDKKIFEQLNTLETPEKLHENVILRIKRAQKIRATIKTALFGSVFFLSIAVLVPAVTLVSDRLSDSGIYQYGSLIITDSNLMLHYWEEFAMLILESAPWTEIAGFLAALLILSLSAKIFIQNLKNMPRIKFTPSSN